MPPQNSRAYFWVKLPDTARLDHLFVDDAGQMSLAQVLAFARAARNLVLLGDPQQLEQPHQGSHPDGAEVAALTHLIGTGRATLVHDQGLFLAETWRLHPAICALSSDLDYDGRLAAVAGATANASTGLASSMAPPCSGSKSNTRPRAHGMRSWS